ncbi:MAG: NAD(P)-dependent oxidoreductase [Steroidobacteraceae bacterium]
MRVAITGACGLLGAHLAAAFSARHTVTGFDRHAWWGERPIRLHTGDLADPKARAAFIEDAQPDLFIHCAALVNVDACEENPAAAYVANGELTGLLARAVPKHCVFVYITTDGVFRGDQPLQRESDLPCPRTVYGRSKVHGEWETELATPEHLIVRTNFYGWSSGVKMTSGEWLYQALTRHEPITLFDDFWFTPIYVVDLVQRILALLAARKRGIFHVVGGERVSKFDYGVQLAQAIGVELTAARRGSIDSAALRAPRPRDMSLDASAATAATGLVAPGCREGLRRFIADRGSSLEARVAHLSDP